MAEPTLLQETLDFVRNGLTQPKLLWQLGIIGAGLVAGTLVSRRVQARFESHAATVGAPGGLRTDVLRFSMGSARRLAFPLGAFITMLTGLVVLLATGTASRGDVHLLRIALTLLAAMAGIRLVVYVLRRSLHNATWLKSAERWIAGLVWLGIALHLTGLLGDVTEILESVRIPIGRSQMTLFDLLLGAVSVVITGLVALWLGSLIESKLMNAQSLTPNSRVVLVRFVKSVLMVVAVLIALASVGIDLTVLSVFGGALGVGLGLGLQRIASNYVSGFIILLERSLSIGDRVTVDAYNGTVTRINTRYTVLDLLNGTEAILPNEMLVSQPVVNHSLTWQRVKLVLKVTVAQVADIERALALLVECAAAQPRVLKEPAPGASVSALGVDGIELELGFWVPDVTSGGLRSDVARTVLKRLAEERIALASPQRNVRLVTVSDGVAASGLSSAGEGKPPTAAA